jgi:hypothetical protein
MPSLPIFNQRRSRNARKQLAYRKRYAEGTIMLTIPVSYRQVEGLRRRAVTYGTLSARESEKTSQQRDWIASEIVEALDEVTDKWL